LRDFLGLPAPEIDALERQQNKQLAAVKTPHEQASLRGQFDATDAQIDAIVYQLYGLSEEEIALVEAATAKI